MNSLARLLTSRWGPIVTGAIVGVLAPVLVRMGNPGNMGVCVACFSRDIAGALGLHRAAPVQYIRPELVGFVLGALAAALVFREFKARTGSAPLVRFLLGMFAVVGALVFLGCPWRAYLRLGGGDWNSLYGILGLAVGIGIGIIFLRLGFSLGRNRPATPALGWMMPVLMGGCCWPWCTRRRSGGTPKESRRDRFSCPRKVPAASMRCSGFPSAPVCWWASWLSAAGFARSAPCGI